MNVCTGKGTRDLDRPSSVAVDDVGQIYIADSFNDRVCVYTTEGDWKFNVGGRGYCPLNNFPFSPFLFYVFEGRHVCCVCNQFKQSIKNRWKSN